MPCITCTQHTAVQTPAQLTTRPRHQRARCCCQALLCHDGAQQLSAMPWNAAVLVTALKMLVILLRASAWCRGKLWHCHAPPLLG